MERAMTTNGNGTVTRMALPMSYLEHGLEHVRDAYLTVAAIHDSMDGRSKTKAQRNVATTVADLQRIEGRLSRTLALLDEEGDMKG